MYRSASGFALRRFSRAVRAQLFSPMTYPFGATKADLEKDFRLAADSTSQSKQEPEPLNLSESELATVLFEHPILGSLADYPNSRLIG